MKISVIIPMYNERKIVAHTIKTLDLALKRDFGENEYEMIFSNDGSTDGCDAVARSMMPSYPALKVIGESTNHGKGYAVRQGMLCAKGDFVLFTDCDLAYGTDVIKRFYEKFKNSGADIVVGSRRIDKSGYEGYTVKRKLMSEAYIRVINIASGYKGTDSQCGIKGFSNESARRIFSKTVVDRFAFDLEALLLAKKAGLKISEAPVKIINHNDSKVRPIHDSVEMLSCIRKIKKNIKNTNI